MTYNQGDLVIVQLGKHIFYNAQVFEDKGNMVHIILKEDTWNHKTFLYDSEYGITKNMIVEKIYDSKTDQNLVGSEN